MLQFLQVTIHRETKRKEEEGRPEEVKIIADDVGFKLVDEYDKKILHAKTLTAAAACLYYLSGKDLPDWLADVALHAIQKQDRRRAKRQRQRLQQNEATEAAEIDLEADLPQI